MTTGLLYDSRYLEHLPGQGHPESPERLRVTLDHLKTLPWFSELKQISSRKAELEWIHEIHEPDYVRHAQDVCERGLSYLDTLDVGVCPESYEIALLASGGVLELADKMMSGTIQNGFALLRPPGHHAEKNSAMGFCLFNNVAILARYLQKKHGLDKILILDWDVHHGNGTQHAFEEDPSVLFISLHQYPFYPGTGGFSETGVGRGKGATLNCPMKAGATDFDYEMAFMQYVLPKVEAFKPQAILISSGFDAHRADPLGQVQLSTEFFGWMSERVIEWAAQYANGRVLSVLEGGYNLEVLPHCVALHLETLHRASS